MSWGDPNGDEMEAADEANGLAEQAKRESEGYGGAFPCEIHDAIMDYGAAVATNQRECRAQSERDAYAALVDVICTTLSRAALPAHDEAAVPSTGPVRADDPLLRRMALECVRDLCESEPTEAAIAGQDALQGTISERCIVVEPAVLERHVHTFLSNAVYEGEIHLAPPPSAATAPREQGKGE